MHPEASDIPQNHVDAVATATDGSPLAKKVTVRPGERIHHGSLHSSLGAVQFPTRYPTSACVQSVDRLANTGLPTMKGFKPWQPSSLLIWILGSSHQVNTF